MNNIPFPILPASQNLRPNAANIPMRMLSMTMIRGGGLDGAVDNPVLECSL